MTRKLALLIAAATLTLTGCGTVAANNGLATTEPELTALEVAVEECNDASVVRGTRFREHITVGDAGRTVTINSEGEESDGASFTDVVCVLAALGVSDAVVSQIDSTRAMDGRQTGSWGDFTASWTYHPNSGLNLIIQAS